MRAFGHVHVACQGQMVEGDAGTPGDSCGCLRVVMEGFTKVRACLALTANGQTSPQWYVASSFQPVRLPRYRFPSHLRERNTNADARIHPPRECG